MCNICNLQPFSLTHCQQWTTVSRFNHGLRPMENFLTFLRLSSPCALPAATKPTCSLSKSQQDKAVPSSRWQEDDGEIHRAREAPWPWILALCVTRGYQPSLQAVRANLQEQTHIWATRYKLGQIQQKLEGLLTSVPGLKTTFLPFPIYLKALLENAVI